MKSRAIQTLLTFLFCSLCAPWALAQETIQTAPAEDAAAPKAIDPSEAMDRLEAAYQKEYAFLEAQLRDLRDRRTRFEEDAREAETSKEAQIHRTEAEWIGLQGRTERIQDLLQEADRELESVEDARTTLEATFLQADSTLEPYAVPELKSDSYLNAPDGDRISKVLGHALRLLADSGKLRESTGSYFLRDGTEVEGRILRLGNVAAFGFSAQGGGALAPAGDGRLKVWADPAAETTAALESGRVPTQLGLFLYESEAKAIEEKQGKTLLSVINSGGTIAWIIAALGVFAGVLIMLRAFFLRGASASTEKIVGEVGNLVRKGEINAALESCKKFKGATARVVAAAVRNLERDRDHLEDIISESILHESAHLNRFGSIILVIAAVSPLLGLLGTVTGMITTFDIITEFGTGDPKLLSGGISIALVTTEIGLAVAIPALLLGNVLSGWAESIKDDMEKGALRVINQFKELRGTA
jgi:biopolymer transport protein ExbB